MRRHKPLLYWLSGKKNDVSFAEIFQFTFSLPFKTLGKRKLRNRIQEDEFDKLEFHDLSKPIYWPKSFPLTSMYQVAAELLYKNWWNYEIKENPIQIDDCVVDCGAAEGAFALHVLGRCKKIYAIEPHPQFVDALKRTFVGINDVEILPVLLGSTRGSAKLSNDGIMSQVSKEGVDIKVETIDSLFWAKDIKVDFIKADLEGYEVNMLKGAVETIKRWHPKLSITTYHNATDYEETYKLVKNLFPGYKIRGVGITDQFGTPIMLHAWLP